MGVWMFDNAKLQVEPPVTEEVVLEYIRFSKETWPEEDKRIDEHFWNPWFFDENNDLISIPCKFAECSTWRPYITKFFENMGYEIIGDSEIIGEGEPGFSWDANEEAYQSWRKRAERLMETNNGI